MPAELSLRRLLPPRAASPGEARSLVRSALREWSLEEFSERAELAVSELVTNALVHAATEVSVDVRLEAGRLRVEVRDGSRRRPVLREHPSTSGTGRGLRMVAEVTDDWGAEVRRGGKVVWFEIGADATVRERASTPGRRARRDPDELEVELLNFPLLIHAAWQEHAAALLREFLLVSLGADESASFARHARAGEAMSVLAEQVPAPVLDEDPHAIMAAATEPGVTLDRLVVRLPPSAVADFATLDEMLTEAVQAANDGLMLVPPTQPEVGEMRRWLCRQVREQALSTASPEPWSSHYDHRTSTEPAGGPERRRVSSSPGAVLAADEHGVIVAVSRLALDFLGYREEEELRGSRLLRIVPLRFHQAHVAGITLHMVNGRSPLLGRPVTLPVVRSDGRETAVGVQITSRLLDRGTRLFVAELLLPHS